MKRTTERPALYVSLFLFVITVALFSQTLFHQFVNLDDFDYITQNSHITSGITPVNVAWAFTTFHASNWHPLTWISHMADCQLFGLNPAGHHLMNVLLHAINAVLLFLFLNRATGALWRSAFVAALFAVHPLHVESVAWVSERKDLLSTFFFLLMVLSYAAYAHKPERKRYLLTVCLFAFSLMAKAMFVTAPFLLLLLDYWPLGRIRKETASADRYAEVDRGTDIPWQRLLLEKIPFLLLAIGCSIVTVYAQRAHAIISLKSHPLPDRIANALIGYVSYMGKMAWPADLAAFYPLPATIRTWQVAAAALLISTITVFAVIRIRRSPYLAVGWLWFLGTLVPVIGLVQVGMQAMADRYTYIPLTGLFIIIVWGCADLAGAPQFQRLQRLQPPASALLLLLLSVATWVQVSYWRDTITLFNHAARVTTDNWFAHTFLGMALDGQGKRDEALPHLYAALQINPEFGKAHYALGVILARTGHPDDAVAHYQAAIQLEPNLAEAYNNLANALADRGLIAEANSLLQQGIGIEPDNARLHYNLAVNMEAQNRFDEALFHYREATRINPAYASAHNNLGFLCSRLGRVDEAVLHLSEAIRIKPELAAARDELSFLTSKDK